MAVSKSQRQTEPKSLLNSSEIACQRILLSSTASILFCTKAVSASGVWNPGWHVADSDALEIYLHLRSVRATVTNCKFVVGVAVSSSPVNDLL